MAWHVLRISLSQVYYCLGEIMPATVVAAPSGGCLDGYGKSGLTTPWRDSAPPPLLGRNFVIQHHAAVRIEGVLVRLDRRTAAEVASAPALNKLLDERRKK